jgi:DNA helicase-2/ATP-dependent DNA helicase PcrA
MGQRKKMESNKAKLQGKKPEAKPRDIHFKRPHAMKRIEDVTNSKSDIHTSAMDLNLQIKSRVIHGRFGVGAVTAIEGEGMDAKAVIAFEHAGEKKLLLKFAKLRLLSK